MCSLDVSHFNTGDGRLVILGKGQTDRREISLPPGCAGAIRTYLAVAGHAEDADGPLIRNCDRNPGSAGGRLTPDGLYKLVGMYGKKSG